MYKKSDYLMDPTVCSTVVPSFSSLLTLEHLWLSSDEKTAAAIFSPLNDYRLSRGMKLFVVQFGNARPGRSGRECATSSRCSVAALKNIEISAALICRQ